MQANGEAYFDRTDRQTHRDQLQQPFVHLPSVERLGHSYNSLQLYDYDMAPPTHGSSSMSCGGSGTSVGDSRVDEADVVDVPDTVCFKDRCGGEEFERRPSPTGTLQRWNMAIVYMYNACVEAYYYYNKEREGEYPHLVAENTASTVSIKKCAYSFPYVRFACHSYCHQCSFDKPKFSLSMFPYRACHPCLPVPLNTM